MRFCAAWPAYPTLALLLACLSGSALAQDPLQADKATWVQVEVLAFRSLDPATSTEETWPAPANLAYPDPIEVLIAPGSPAHAAAIAAQEFESTLAAEERPATSNATTDTQPVATIPFVLLEATETALAAPAARLANATRQRLLGHLAWRQPLPATSQGTRVLITAGTQTGSHHEFEGYLSLKRSRYLHADGRFWLNDFSAPAEPGTGVDLPALPMPAAADFGAPGAQDTGTPGDEGMGAAEPPSVPEPVHTVRTVGFSASRGLSPREVHYLDHPLFGVLLSVRPWDPSATAAIDAQDGQLTLPDGAEETPPPDGPEETPLP